jgi:hypothetical protein
VLDDKRLELGEAVFKPCLVMGDFALLFIRQHWLILVSFCYKQHTFGVSYPNPKGICEMVLYLTMCY